MPVRMRAQEAKAKDSERPARGARKPARLPRHRARGGRGQADALGAPKVLAPIAGLPMLAHVLAAVPRGGRRPCRVVVGPGREDVAAAARAALSRRRGLRADGAARHGPCGARGARALSQGKARTCSSPSATRRWSKLRRSNICATSSPRAQHCVVLGFRGRQPDMATAGSCGSKANWSPSARRRTRAARNARITLCNGGLMALSGTRRAVDPRAHLNENAQREFYLTDAVEIARRLALETDVVIASESEVMGVNDRVQLAGGRGLDARAPARGRDAGRRHAHRAANRVPSPMTRGSGAMSSSSRMWCSGKACGSRRERGSAPSLISRARMWHRARSSGLSRVCGPAPDRRGGPYRQFRRGEECADRLWRQGEPPRLSRRCFSRFGNEHRGGRHHLQLRRVREAPHRDRRAGFHRHEQLARRPRSDRQGCLRGFRFGDHAERARRIRSPSAARARR